MECVSWGDRRHAAPCHFTEARIAVATRQGNRPLAVPDRALQAEF